MVIMNVKSMDDQVAILRCLVEGNSIRSTVRLTGAAKNTVIRLLERTGEACQDYQDKTLTSLPCRNLQCDEIWSFVGSKGRNAAGKRNILGDVWTWTAICADTKVVPSWLVGQRTDECAKAFMRDLASRISDRVQITTDGLSFYKDAIEEAFAADADYAMLEKHYGRKVDENGKKYGQHQYLGSTKRRVAGQPDLTKATTSYMERCNLGMRMGMRRFTRETNAFSKKIENHCHAIALHFMHYNFVRIHKSLRVSPAMEAGVSDHLLDLQDIVAITNAYWKDKSN